MESLSLRVEALDVALELKQKVLVLPDGFSYSSLKPAEIKTIIQARMRLQTQLRQALQNKTLQNYYKKVSPFWGSLFYVAFCIFHYLILSLQYLFKYLP